jgi:bifunctional non-homologous end joining protein LigD
VSLREYREKRKFQRTPEPKGRRAPRAGPLRFVVQKHRASHLHYDFRLELDGVLKSWAVPKGPSLNPLDKRLAMMTEDHPLDYRTFEGVIPEGNYGAGAVMVWDEGTYGPAEGGDEKTLREGMRAGRLHFVLSGQKLRGEWILARMKGRQENSWLLMKKDDKFAVADPEPLEDRSAATGRSLEQIAMASDKTWSSNRRKERRTAVDLTGAPKTDPPRQVAPMLAMLVEESFDRPGWFFEVKWDGYRAIGEKVEGRVRLYSRNGLSFAEKFPPVAEALKELPLDAVVDGEVTALDPEGKPSFQDLQNYQRTGKGNLVYYVFDLLWLNGRDLRGWPLAKRKTALAAILPVHPGLRLSDHVEEKGRAFLEAATDQGLEGIVAKDAQSPYREGVRSRDWLKIKTILRQEAVVAGFTEPRGGRKHMGALILGVYENKELVYIGHTGGGFTDKTLADTRRRLNELTQKDCPFGKRPKTNAPVHWVQPRLVCEVAFRQWTEDGHMRMPIFLGWREDKPAQDVRRERPVKGAVPPAAPAAPEETSPPRRPGKFFGTQSPRREENREISAGGHRVKLTHLNKLYWPDEKITKGDLLAYYRQTASLMMPYLRDRPESLHRYPDGVHGESFYQKNFDMPLPEWVETVNIRSDTESRNLRYIVCQNEATLLYMANLGCIEINPWNSRTAHLDRPDYLVIDLDPVEVPFETVIDTARAVKEVLDEGGIRGYCKTSGGRGLHIFVPLGARYTNDQSRTFAEILVNLVHERTPRITSLERSPLKRRHKVYLDFLQNRRGQTLAAPYCVRPKPGAPVSTPLRWEEVKKGLDPKAFNIRSVHERIHKLGDIWKPVLGRGIDLTGCLRRLEGGRKRRGT